MTTAQSKEVYEQIEKVLALMGAENAAFKKIPEDVAYDIEIIDGETSEEVRAYQQAQTQRIDAELDLMMMLRKVGGIDA